MGLSTVTPCSASKRPLGKAATWGPSPVPQLGTPHSVGVSSEAFSLGDVLLLAYVITWGHVSVGVPSLRGASEGY